MCRPTSQKVAGAKQKVSYFIWNKLFIYYVTQVSHAKIFPYALLATWLNGFSCQHKTKTLYDVFNCRKLFVFFVSCFPFSICKSNADFLYKRVIRKFNWIIHNEATTIRPCLIYKTFYKRFTINTYWRISILFINCNA